ncbi:DNA cytosine methyltransferase [Streptomyces sp. NBC_01343]|uniref:DNA cytosine methyltransferase n=1 Tax=Streptomyces sp. NBC_01343 TaxID=2903832 RepID=UPI003FA35CFD
MSDDAAESRFPRPETPDRDHHVAESTLVPPGPLTHASPDFTWDPSLGDDGLVRITVNQTALRQALPETWRISGLKTARYRQIGHATPPPVGEALGLTVAEALNGDPRGPAAG